MKTLTFKRPLMVAMLCLTYIIANAQGVIVYKKDGTKIKVPYEQLDSISTYNYNDEPGIGGGDNPNPDESIMPYTHAVDLGLSVKWADMNVGAEKPEDYGWYLAWGETEEKSTYNWGTYKWCNGSSSTMTKYNTLSWDGKVDNKTVLDPEDDAATVNWGGDWRMPTREELSELRGKCTWTWTTQNGVVGYKVTSSNGNSIFLPAGSNLSCRYWSCSLDTSSSSWATSYNPEGGYILCVYRYAGLSVRPVYP